MLAARVRAASLVPEERDDRSTQHPLDRAALAALHFRRAGNRRRLSAARDRARAVARRSPRRPACACSAFVVARRRPRDLRLVRRRFRARGTRHAAAARSAARTRRARALSLRAQSDVRGCARGDRGPGGALRLAPARVSMRSSCSRVFHLFVIVYEESALRRDFDGAYRALLRRGSALAAAASTRANRRSAMAKGSTAVARRRRAHRAQRRRRVRSAQRGAGAGVPNPDLVDHGEAASTPEAPPPAVDSNLVYLRAQVGQLPARRSSSSRPSRCTGGSWRCSATATR